MVKYSSSSSRRELPQKYIKAALKTDPTYFLHAYGFHVKKTSPTHYSVSQFQNGRLTEIYRIDFVAQEDKFKFCTKHGLEGGDLIDLYSRITGMPFHQAVAGILGQNIDNLNEQKFNEHQYVKKQDTALAQARAQSEHSEPLMFPSPTTEEIEQGRKYLHEVREISIRSIITAENAGFVSYKKNGVLFCGLDEAGQIRSATFRATVPHLSVQKMDIKGSNKSYSGLILGNPKKVWIVEGGVDALALMDISARQHLTEHPTIIVSGGSGVMKWLERDVIINILKGAEKITIALENEKDAQTQFNTDTAHKKQGDRIEQLTGIKVTYYKPSIEQGKDLAEFNKWQARFKERKKQAQVATSNVVANV